VKRFKFTLQSVATVRTWREQEAREAFARALNLLKQAEDDLQMRRQRVAGLEVQLRHAQASTFRPAEHAAAVLAYQRERLAAEESTQRCAAAQAASDQARLAWQNARNQLRVVGQLEQRARQLHRFNEERCEQSVLDEMAALRVSRPSTPRS
jgi:flagellar export protein FliJ